jgi:hypothetical protein
MPNLKQPAWLASFQADFSDRLRQKLDSSSGTLRSRHQADSGWASYNRQYYFRLFQCLQQAYPRVAALLGYWRFNHIVQDYLAEFPPQHFDLAQIGQQLPAYLAHRLGEEARALEQAARIDQAFEQVFLAPQLLPFSITQSQEDPAQLRLLPGHHWRIIVQDWPLLDGRVFAAAAETEGPCSLPPRLSSGPEFWLLLRTQDHSISEILLSPLQAEFYTLLSDMTLGEALQKIELTAEQFSGEELAAQIQNWLALSVAWQLWIAP